MLTIVNCWTPSPLRFGQDNHIGVQVRHDGSIFDYYNVTIAVYDMYGNTVGYPETYFISGGSMATWDLIYRPYLEEGDVYNGFATFAVHALYYNPEDGFWYDDAQRVFSLAVYSPVLTIMQPGSGYGSTNPLPGSSTKAMGQWVSVQATPAGGYVFDHWEVTYHLPSGTSQTTSPANPFNFYINYDTDLRPFFKSTSVRLTTSIKTNGSAGGAGGTISPPSGEYNYNEVVTVTATPASKYTFYRFAITRGQSTQFIYNPTVQVTMDGDVSVVAEFISTTYSVVISVKAGEGTTSPAPGSYQMGGTQTFSAIPAQGWMFDHWIYQFAGDIPHEIGNPTLQLPVDANLTLDAYFRSGTGQTSVLIITSASGGYTVPAAGTYPAVPINTETEVAAQPDSTHLFLKWTLYGGTFKPGYDGKSNPVRIIQSSTSVLLQPSFVEETQAYILQTAALPSGGGKAEGGGTYLYGEVATVKAIPNPGYAFVKWAFTVLGEPDIIRTDIQVDWTVTTNTTATAYFERTGGSTNALPLILAGGAIAVIAVATKVK